MKKYSIFLLILLLILTSCSNSSTKQKTENATNLNNKNLLNKIIVWADSKNIEALESSLESFEAQFGVKVEIKEVNKNKVTEKYFDTSEKERPNIIMLNDQQVGLANQLGILEKLNIKKEIKEKYFNYAIDALSYKGQTYGIPNSIDPVVFVYNQSKIKNDVKTLEELKGSPEKKEDKEQDKAKDTEKSKEKAQIEVVKTTEKDEYENEITKPITAIEPKKELTEEEKQKLNEQSFPFFINWYDYKSVAPLLNSYGSYVFGNEKNGFNPENIGLNNAGTKQGLKFIQEWTNEMNVQYLDLNKNSVEEWLKEGKIYSTFMPYEKYLKLKEEIPSLKIISNPTLNGKQIKPLIAVDGWFVTSKKENQKYAVQFVEHLTMPINIKYGYETTNQISPTDLLLKVEEKPEKEKDLKIILNQDYLAIPNIPEMNEVWLHVKNALELSIDNKQNSDEALDDATEMIKYQIMANHPPKKN